MQATEWPTSVYGPNPLTSVMCRHSMVTRFPSAGWRGLWDDGAHGFRGALVRDDELVHVLVVPGPARVAGLSVDITGYCRNRL